MDDIVLTEQGVFLTTDARGEIPLDDPAVRGLYYQDTRFLSGFELRLNGVFLSPLRVVDDGFRTQLIYASLGGVPGLPAHLVLRRARYIDLGTGDRPGAPLLRELLSVTNYDRAPLDLALALRFAADFQDMLNVRNFLQRDRPQLGTQRRPEVAAGGVAFIYDGLDGVERRTTCTLSPFPTSIDVQEAPVGPHASVEYSLRIPSHETVTIELAITLKGVEDEAQRERDSAPATTFAAGFASIAQQHADWLERDCTGIETDSAHYNAVIARSVRDLRLLLVQQPTGPYIVAGIPIFAVPFGRDGLIAATQTLLLNPNLAAGTLRYLAAHQGKDVNPARDETPGKIMHEMRFGESVRLGQLPFGPYYGTVDATLLFLVLLGRLMQWRYDTALLHDLAPALRAAVAWIDSYGDVDRDGFVEFENKAARGLSNQGWKDAHDSLQLPDGRFPAAPIALVEVQGYTYEARLAAAAVLRRLGDVVAAEQQEAKATALQRRFNDVFWLPNQQCYAQALDAEKQPVPAVTSTAGHVLWSGIADPDKARQLAARLLADDVFSGWGLRTLSTTYPSYDPLSYQNGSVWPHDTALVAAGLQRYGENRAAATLCDGIFAAALGYDQARLPELFGGFPREDSPSGPVPYPVACSPQAWAAGSAVHLVQTLLGLEPADGGARLTLRPHFPSDLGRIRLQRLRIGSTTMELTITATATGYDLAYATAAGATGQRSAAAGEEIALEPGA